MRGGSLAPDAGHYAGGELDTIERHLYGEGRGNAAGSAPQFEESKWRYKWLRSLSLVLRSTDQS